MSKFNDFKDDLEFSKLLLEEEMVFVLPGKIFKMQDYVRLVVTPPPDKLTEACDRIEAFCKRHTKMNQSTLPDNNNPNSLISIPPATDQST